MKKRRPIVKLTNHKCPRCGCRVVVAGRSCTTCMTTSELLAWRAKEGR